MTKESLYIVHLLKVKIAWSQLSASLVLANSPGLINRLIVENEEHRAEGVRRELWRIAVNTLTSREPAPAWTDLVDLLALPLRYVEMTRTVCVYMLTSFVSHWAMDEEDWNTWDIVLQHAVSEALLVSYHRQW